MLGSLLLYLAVSLMDPGYVTAQPQPQVTLDLEVHTPPRVNREVRPLLMLTPELHTLRGVLMKLLAYPMVLLLQG